MIATVKTDGRKRRAETLGKVTLIPAVGYIRMSSPQQEDSPAQQREQIEEYAADHGYRIVRWYEDLGISGDDSKKRTGFRQMIRDAENDCDFEVIICWKTDRFGRFDSIEAGRWISPLREAGVQLVTVTEGLQDWNSFEGRVMYGIVQEGKNKFLKDLAENVLRGRLKTFRTSYPHGSVPPGYDRLYFDESGKLQHRVHSYERFRKPPGWVLQIEPSTDNELVEAVKWAFETMDSPGGNAYRVTCEFNRRGVPSKCGGDWSDSHVRAMLKNRAYIGVRSFGKERRGKYRYVDGKGKIVKSGKSIDKSPPLEIEDAHPAMIDRELFERVQEKLNTKRKPRNRNSDHILTGLLHCAHCGKAVVGNSRWLKSGARTRDYLCTGPVIGICKSRRVNAEELEGYIVKHIQDGIDQAAGTMEGYVREALARRTKPTTSTKSLRKRLGSVEAKITRATRNMLLLDDRAAQEAAKMLAEMQAESESIRDEIAPADGGAGAPRKPAEIVAKAMGKTIRHRRDVRPGGPPGDENGNP